MADRISRLQPFVWPLISLLLFLCFQHGIESWLWDFNISWLTLCNEVMGGVLIIFLAIILTWLLWSDGMKMKLSLAHFGWLAVVVGLYLYYRFFTAIFYFWGFSIYRIEIAYMDFFLLPLLLLVKIQFEVYTEKMEKREGKSMLDKDEPINEKDADLLGYGTIISTLMSDLQLLDLSNGSFSVGIAGEWGIGKSSFFELFKNQLNEAYGDKVVVVEFNPRASTDVKDIQRDFFDTFASQLMPFYSGISRDMRRYQDALQLPEDNFVVRLLRLLPSLTVTGGKNAINEVISNLNKRIFVFVDDFDRLTAEEILEMMKVIDRNGDFRQTIYITAYDKDYVNSVLKKKLGYDKQDAYTDKYFSYELHLPTQPTKVLKDYVKDVLAKKLTSEAGDAISVKEMQTQWDGQADTIVGYLHTLRHVKRFLNIFLSRYSVVRNDVNFGDFVSVTLLRYFDIGTYHALVEGRLTKSGGTLTDNTDKVFYQADDIEELLKQYSKWDGAKDILDKLIGKNTPNDYQLTSRYKRLQMKESFACYFYDYQANGVYHKDLMRLYDAESDDKAIEILHELIKYDKGKHGYDQGAYVAVENFLRIRPLEELRWSGDVLRLFILLCHLNDIFARPLNIETSIAYFFTKDAADKLDDTMEGDYKGKLSKAVKKILGEHPWCLANTILRINQDLLQPEVNEGDYAFTQAEIQELAELCQRSYFNLVDGITSYNFDTVMNLSKVMVVKDGKQAISDAAKDRFFGFISDHADDFVKSAVNVVRTQTEMPKLNIFIRNSFEPSSFFPYKGLTLPEWVRDNVKGAYNAYIFNRLMKESKQALMVPLAPPQYGIDVTNFEKVYDVVKAEDEVVEENKVKEAMKGNISNSIEKLANQTGIQEGNVREALRRMTQKGKLSSLETDIADKIPAFRVGDFVSTERGVYKVATIKDEVATLTGVAGEAKLEMLEAVPIDGVHDRNIYYAPAVAANGVSSSPDPDIYYMQSFENFFDVDGKKYSDIVRERNYHFVHEIQHWLQDENNDGLKINRR